MNTVRRILLKLFFGPTSTTLGVWCQKSADRLLSTHKIGHVSWVYSGGQGLDRIVLVLATGDNADKLSQALCASTCAPADAQQEKEEG